MNILLKNWRLLILIMCMVLTLGLFYFSFARPVYYARSLAKMSYLEKPEDNQTMFQDFHPSMVIKSLYAQHLAERVADSLGHKLTYREISEKLIKQIRCSVSQDNIVEIRVWGYDPNATRKWGEALIDEYMAHRREKRRDYRNTIVTEYTKEMETVAEKFVEARSDELVFDNVHGLSEKNMQLHQLRTVPVELTKIENRIAEMETILQKLNRDDLDVVAKLSVLSTYMEKKLNLGKEVKFEGGSKTSSFSEDRKDTSIIITPTLTDKQDKHHEWQDVLRKKIEIEKEIEELSEVFLPGHKKMRELAAELSKHNKELRNRYEAAYEIFLLEYAYALDERKVLVGKLPVYKDKQRQVDQISMKFEALKSKQQAWDRIQKSLGTAVGKVDYAITKDRIELAFLGLVENPHDSQVPNKGKLLIMSSILAVGIAIGFAYFMEFLDTSVSRLEKVEDDLNIRSLGLIPMNPEEEGVDDPFGNDANKHLSENFRVIRTNILLNTANNTENGRDTQVLIVTSSIPKEGKSFVSMKLAKSFAQLGEKTLLIDADLRRGSMGRRVKPRLRRGLRDILIDKGDFEELKYEGAHEHLTLLASGKYSADAIEALGSQRFAKLVEYFRTKYDKIIIDCPPYMGLPEVPMIMPLSDGIVFIIWAGRTSISNIKTSVEHIQSNGGNIVGFVLNRIDFSNTGKYYNYYTYYYYTKDYYRGYQSTGPDTSSETKTIT